MAVQLYVEVPSTVAGWSSRPAPFSTQICGTRVKFSKDSSVAERVEPNDYSNDAVVYTAKHLALGQLWQITILNIIRVWFYGLVSG